MSDSIFILLIIMGGYLIGWTISFFMINWAIKYEYINKRETLMENFSNYFVFDDFPFFAKEKKYSYFWVYYLVFIHNLIVSILIFVAFLNINNYIKLNNGFIIIIIIFFFTNMAFLLWPIFFWRKIKRLKIIASEKTLILKFNTFKTQYLNKTESYIDFTIFQNNKKWYRNFAVVNYEKKIKKKIKKIYQKEQIKQFQVVNLFIKYFTVYSCLLKNWKKDNNDYFIIVSGQEAKSLEELKMILINNFFSLIKTYEID